MALSKKYQTFVDEYLKRFNATEAYMFVYPKSSYNSARANSIRLIARDNIKAEINKRLEEHHMSSDIALKLLSDQAFADLSEFIMDNGSIDWSMVKKKGRLIKKIKHHSEQNSEIELHDSQRALELIGKVHKLFVDRYEVEGKLSVVGLDEILERAYGKKE